MNRKNLTAAVLAGLAGTAGIASTVQAVNLNPGGLGQVLIYPYYTVNGGNITVLSVVNTSEDAKAVKVRFLEGGNSYEVLDFNLYMSAYDVWTAAIVDDGGPTLKIADRTCTVPDLVRDFGGSQKFLDTLIVENDDNETDPVARMSEGHFEMIEMGTLVDIDEGSATAATHVAPADYTSGPAEPEDCGQLVDAWTQGPDGIFGSSDDGYWIQDPLEDIETPSGGLFGGAAILNGEDGTFMSYDATALNGFADSVFGADFIPLHSFPGNENPSLNDGNIMDAVVFAGNGNTRSASFSRGVDAVSYVFMHDAIMNEYSVDAAIGAASEWVVTFPTKNFYVNVDPVIDPFMVPWAWNATAGRYESCEPMLLAGVWDREETLLDDTQQGDDCEPVVSPGEVECGNPLVPFRLCNETNVIRFGDVDEAPAEGTEIMGATNFTNFDPKLFKEGWARIDMTAFASGNVGAEIIDYRDPLDGFGDLQWGLPVAGFWAFALKNTFLGDGADVIANYGGLFDHKTSRCFDLFVCRDINPQ